MAKFYITTTLPYVNSDPHIGFALELIQADVIARHRRLLGDEVFFNTGTDEHGVKIYRKAQEAGQSTQAYVDAYAEKFKQLVQALNASTTHFVRTTDAAHKTAAQEFWKRCAASGDIYKGSYRIKYCIGCELEKTDSELEDGRCPIHPNLAIEEREEENYFFRWSKYGSVLLDLYKNNPSFVVPQYRLNEITRFVEGGLKDFSISRLASKMPWGVSVPGDPEHVMFVWFDALVNYISSIGWPTEEEGFRGYWPGVQIAGKDNLRQQSAMWQGMLLSAGLPTSKKILIHGFINVQGQKMSKSLGNVVDPFALVEQFGTDAVRYFLLREIPFGEDGDFSMERLEGRYESDLANGLGNLVQRVTTLASRCHPERSEPKTNDGEGSRVLREAVEKTWQAYDLAMAEYRFHDALTAIWALVKTCDEYVETKKPWTLAGDELAAVVAPLVESLRHIAWMLWPAMPATAETIFDRLGILDASRGQSLADARQWSDAAYTVTKGTPMFPRRSA